MNRSLISLIVITSSLLSGCSTTIQNALINLLPRPQHPKERPYVIEPVSVAGGLSGIVLEGELTRPDGDGPFPAMLLIAGSGPNDRDQTISGHKTLLVLSDYFTRRGYAVLRYDKRGIASSTGDYSTATMDDFASDAAAAMRWLKSKPYVNRQRTVFLGHSTGGYVAALAATREDVTSIVSLGTPAETLLDTLLRQSIDIPRAEGKSEQWAMLNHQATQEIVSILKTTENPEQAKTKALQRFAHYQSELGLPKNHLKRYFKLVPVAWFKHALNYDPAPVVVDFSGPYLAVFGSKDTQVAVQPNASLMKTRLSHEKSAVMVIDGLNHLFQLAQTGAISEYQDITITFDPDTMLKIADWLDSLADSPH